MGLAHGGDIVSDGLVLCLDAGNVRSYPGNGSTWTDLSKNGNNGTLINGPTFSSDNGGSIVFDGVNDGVQLVHNNFWVLLPTDKFSLCFWFYAEPTTQTGSKLFSHQKCNSPTFNIVVNDTTSLAFRVAGNSNAFAIYSANVTGNWNYAVSTFSGSSGDMKLYLNGNLVATNTNDAGWSSYAAGYSEVWLGRRYPCANTDEIAGKIALFSFYKGKELTIQEIRQNYLATKGRFNL